MGVIHDNRRCIPLPHSNYCYDFWRKHSPILKPKAKKANLMFVQSNSPAAAAFAYPYSLMEKIQVTAFCIQEFIISGLYVYYTRLMLKPGEAYQKKRTRQVMLHLIYVNLLVILMDVILLCTEYANLYEIQITFKGAVYSVKLRLEFAILNDLMRIAGPADSSNEGAYTNSVGRDTGLQLGTVNARKDGQDVGNYTCTASGSGAAASPYSGKEGENVVVLTTEVVVKNEQGRARDSLDTIELEGGKGGAGGRTRQTRSSNSSEVEFADAGF